MEITLNPTEFHLATEIGKIRQLQNLMKGREDAYGAEKMDGWGIHIEGACGEAAVAKLLNIYYNGNMGDLKAVDVNQVGKKIEVRSTTWDTGRLIIHDRDKDDAYFILLTGKAPKFRVRGYILGHHAKQQKYWSDPKGGRPAYFVPQSDLLPIQDLLNKN